MCCLVFILVFPRFQTRLLCIANKPCFDCKEALFAMQRSLVFRSVVTRWKSMVFNNGKPNVAKLRKSGVPPGEGGRAGTLCIRLFRLIFGRKTVGYNFLLPAGTELPWTLRKTFFDIYNFWNLRKDSTLFIKKPLNTKKMIHNFAVTN